HLTDFRNSVVIMTSNVGVSEVMKGRGMGFSDAANENALDNARMKGIIMEEIKKTFKPEFLNRIDYILVFRALDKENLCSIVRIMLGEVSKRAADRGVTLEIGDDTVEFLLEKGYDPKYGARPLRRAIQKYVEDPLSNEILEGKITPGDLAASAVKDGKVVFVKK
ncbi:MAG: AAA family ATPase, partial [Synergistaceae bacterium]|nr:AAA family ATPase [Synergistaceae bacterium]